MRYTGSIPLLTIRAKLKVYGYFSMASPSHDKYYMMMIRLTLICAIIVTLSSCTSIGDSQDVETTDSDDLKKNDTIISVAGCWISEEYYNSIREFKSPKKAQEGSQFIVIPNKARQQTAMIYNFHEGGSSLAVLKNEGSYEIWNVEDELQSHRLCAIEIISSDKIRLDNKSFVKINPLETQGSYRILEEILFQGQYTNADSMTIEFARDGQVAGWGKFTYYEPVIDYFDAGMQVDQIRLGYSQSNAELFGFKFDNDTLELYNLDCLLFEEEDNRCVEVTYGQLVCKLWRKE